MTAELSHSSFYPYLPVFCYLLVNAVINLQSAKKKAMKCKPRKYVENVHLQCENYISHLFVTIVAQNLIFTAMKA